AVRAHRFEIESAEQGELLQEDGPLAPGSGLADGEGAIVKSDRVLDRGTPGGEIVSPQQATMPHATGIHQLRAAEEAVDRFGDEALIPDAPRRFDLACALTARRFRLADDALEGRREMWAAESHARLRALSARQPDVGRSRPFPTEQRLDIADDRCRVRQQ